MDESILTRQKRTNKDISPCYRTRKEVYNLLPLMFTLQSELEFRCSGSKRPFGSLVPLWLKSKLLPWAMVYNNISIYNNMLKAFPCRHENDSNIFKCPPLSCFSPHWISALCFACSVWSALSKVPVNLTVKPFGSLNYLPVIIEILQCRNIVIADASLTAEFV